MKKFTLSSLLFLFAFAMASTTFTSCGDDDPVPGCTDADADNFNEAADSDDSSCMYFSRFVGEYDGTFSCAFLPFSSVDLTISQAAGTTDMLSMLATSPTLPIPISLQATIVDKNNITVTQSLPAIDLSALLPDPPYPASLRWDIQIDGDLERQSDGSFSGELDFVLTEVTSNGAVDPIEDTCTFTAVPK